MSNGNTSIINVRTNWKHSAIEQQIRELDVSQQDMSRSAIFEREVEVAAHQQTDWAAVQESLQSLQKDESISTSTSFQAKISEKTSELIPSIRAEIIKQLGMKLLQNQYLLLLLHANYILLLKQRREEIATAVPSLSAAGHTDSAKEKVNMTAKRREKGLKALTWNLHYQGGLDPRDIPD